MKKKVIRRRVFICTQKERRKEGRQVERMHLTRFIASLQGLLSGTEGNNNRRGRPEIKNISFGSIEKRFPREFLAHP